MTHLSDEQIEALLGEGREDPHLRECPACRQRLAEARAVRERVRKAFASVEPPAGFAERLRRSLQQPPVEDAPAAAERPRRPLYIRLLPVLAAAAVLLIAIPAGYEIFAPAPAAAALAQIHADGVAGRGGFRPETDVGRMTAYLAGSADVRPEAPTICQRCSTLAGGCAAEFRGRRVPAYCITTPEGKVTIIDLAESPGDLGLERAGERNGLPVWTGEHDGTRLAATVFRGRTYVAVGELAAADMADLLTWAVPRAAEASADGGAPPFVCPFCGRHAAGQAQ